MRRQEHLCVVGPATNKRVNYLKHCGLQNWLTLIIQSHFRNVSNQSRVPWKITWMFLASPPQWEYSISSSLIHRQQIFWPHCTKTAKPFNSLLWGFMVNVQLQSVMGQKFRLPELSFRQQRSISQIQNQITFPRGYLKNSCLCSIWVPIVCMHLL